MVEIRVLSSWDTELSADSVEWCPIASLRHLFVCGTYQLTESGRQEQLIPSDDNQLIATRLGRLYLLSFTDPQQVPEVIQTVELPAVLDSKWAPRRVLNRVLVAVVTAAGDVRLFRLVQECLPDRDGVGLMKEKLLEEARVSLPREEAEKELLGLSLDWCLFTDDARIAASDSLGRISVLRLDETGLHVEHNWTAHQFEAWTLHFDPFSPDICYTGGDDSRLRVYDLRTVGGSSTAAQVTISAHTAGVTSLSCPRLTQNQLLSGSYDEQVLLWDTRQMKRFITSATTGGGVWRLRWKPNSEDLILAASMYHGFNILDSSLKVLAEFKEHQSIAYGADWTHLSSVEFPSLLSDNTTLFTTCSFYDHKLCVSMLQKK